MIYPSTYETKVGFNKIRQMVEDNCITKLAKQKLENVSFSTNYNFVFTQLSQTNEMKDILLCEDNFPQCTYVDVIDFLKKITAEGSYMLALELLDLSNALKSAKDIVGWFKKCDEEKYPELKKISENIILYPATISKIDETINKHGKVKDNASPELAHIRKSIFTLQQQINKKIYSILRNAQAEGIIEESTSISFREGRMVIPVSAGNKKKIKGFVHDESATGKTAYIEPIEIVELNNEIKALEHDEKREIIKILMATADFLRPYINDLIAIGDFIGEIDFIHAKAKFCIKIEANMPIVTAEPKLNLRNAKHPILMRALAKEGKTIVPLNLNLDNDKHILLISGPNAGGKSVCLKTVGLLQYMLQCGFLVSALENSEFGIFSDIFIDIGDEQSIENDLSTYSSHLLNMKTVLRNASNKSLVLIDEFGTGTEPIIGGAIAEAVLTKLTERRTFGIITTHYTNLKHFAANNQGIANGAMLFDTQKIQPLFKLEIGIPGSSFAFEIARKIGLPEEILTLASSKLGDKQMNLEKSLREIARDKRYWENKRNKVRQTDKFLEELTNKYESELIKLKEEKRTIIAKAKEEASSILANTNKHIENTIRTIKESQAEKEQTRIARKQLNDFKEQISNSDDQIESDKVDKKIEQLKQRQQKRAEQQKNQTPKLEEKKPKKEKSDLEIGIKVRIKGQTAIGEIIKISNKNILISYGNIMTSINADNIEIVSNNEYHKTQRDNRAIQPKLGVDIGTRKLNFKPQLDVRGMRSEEAISAIEFFLDEAIMLGYSDLKILHGKGDGILKSQIRNMLKDLNFIKSCEDEHVDFGGAGITVIKI